MPFKKTGDGGNGGGAAPGDMDAFIFDKWGPFSTDQGFVANQAPVVGSSPTREYWTHQASTGPPFCFMRTKADQLFMFSGHSTVDISGSEEVFDQPNNPANSPSTTGYLSDDTVIRGHSCAVVNNSNGPWSNHFLFSNAAGDYIHAVCQISARVWRHFHYGVMPAANKYGTWTGGTYFMGHLWSPVAGAVTDPYDITHVTPYGPQGANALGQFQKHGGIHCEGLVSGVEWFMHNAGISVSGESNAVSKDIGGVNNSAYLIGQARFEGYELTFGSFHKRLGRSLISLGTPLVPVTVMAKFDFGGNIGHGAIGTIPDVFFVNMKDFSPAETITLGSDDYIVFPVTNSDTVTTVNGDEYSGYEGLAYKVIP